MLPVVVGDNIVDVLIDRRISSIGGNCLNVAVHMNRVGQPARYVGSVGDDAAGQWVLECLAAESVDVASVTVVPDAQTGYAVIRHRDGEREFGDFDRGASQLRLTEQQWQVIAEASLIHTSYSSALEEELPRLSRIAPVSFDFDTHVDDAYADSLLPFVSHAFFSGATRDVTELHDYAERLLTGGVTSVTITRGAQGAHHWRAGQHWFQPARPVRAVDTLGAGDAYIARMLVGLIRDESPEEAMAGAADLAASVCSTFGALGLNLPGASSASTDTLEKEIVL